MSFPYLDKNGFSLRTVIPLVNITTVETQRPGFTVQRLSSAQSYINARLRKRYGNAPEIGNSLPFGQKAPALVPSGLNPPQVSLSGCPVLGSLQIQVAMIAGGALGTAKFAWSPDNGATWYPVSSTGPSTLAAIQAGGVTPITTAVPAYTLGSTGMQVTFPVGTYDVTNFYASATPVPEAVLGWMVAMVSVDIMRARGCDPDDPQIRMVFDEGTRAIAEIDEASDAKDGRFDLPVSDDLDSAVTTAGVLSYSQTSPYIWTDIEQALGIQQDCGIFGLNGRCGNGGGIL